MLFLSSLSMAVGSFLFGNLPLAIPLSESHLSLTTTFGAGLLLGTAFAVILPEGVEAVFKAQLSIVAAHLHEEEAGIELAPNLSDIDFSAAGADIGTWMIAGFAFMLLADQLGLYFSQKRAHQPVPISVNDFSRSRDIAHTSTPALGFLIHAGADGIALGSAFAADPDSTLGWIVFFAILLHKGPAAFGFATFLLSKRYSKLQIMNQVAIFSIASPLGAIATYSCILLWGGGDPIILGYRTGLVLLFSAGIYF